MNNSTLHSKKLSLILVLSLTTLTMSGCWNLRELNTIAIVAASGIDKEGPDQIKVTAQVFKPGNIQSPQAGAGSGKKPYVNFDATATSVFEAVRKITQTASRKLYWAHNQILIFGKETAEDGLDNYIDFFLRDHETRLMVNILVAKGAASEILSVQSDLETTPAININDIFKAISATSQAPQITLKDIIEGLLSKTTSTIAPLIELTEENKKKRVNIAGTAVFKRGKMVGELNPLESRGLLWIIGKVQSGIIVVNCPDSNKTASLEIIWADSEIIPEIQNEQLSITVKIKEEGTLGDQNCPKDLTKLEAWSSLEKLKTAAIHNEITSALKKAQEYNTDIFGFGEAIHRKYPLLWKDIENQWDELFPQLKVNIKIKAKLRRSGLITKAVSPQGKND